VQLPTVKDTTTKKPVRRRPLMNVTELRALVKRKGWQLRYDEKTHQADLHSGKGELLVPGIPGRTKRIALEILAATVGLVRS